MPQPTKRDHCALRVRLDAVTALADGYAIRAIWTSNATPLRPVRLRVIGHSTIMEPVYCSSIDFEQSTFLYHCFRVSRGAPLPVISSSPDSVYLDAVVPLNSIHMAKEQPPEKLIYDIEIASKMFAFENVGPNLSVRNLIGENRVVLPEHIVRLNPYPYFINVKPQLKVAVNLLAGATPGQQTSYLRPPISCSKFLSEEPWLLIGNKLSELGCRWNSSSTLSLSSPLETTIVMKAQAEARNDVILFIHQSDRSNTLGTNDHFPRLLGDALYHNTEHGMCWQDHQGNQVFLGIVEQVKGRRFYTAVFVLIFNPEEGVARALVDFVDPLIRALG